MKPSAFEYHAAKSAEEAVALLAQLGDGAKVLAGGQSLVPMLSLRLAVFDHLVDVSRVDELKGIDELTGNHGPGSAIRIGAATTEAAVERSASVATSVPLLARATPLIGHFQIRNRGTVGGSIAHADPAAEYPAVALALDAEIETLSPRGARSIPARDFFTGLWATALEPDELLVGVRFPIWPQADPEAGRCGFAVREFARRHGDFAIAGAAVAVELGSDDTVRRSAIGLIGLASTPVRGEPAEQALAGAWAGDLDPREVGRLAVSALDEIPSDLQGDASYRRRVGAAMVARAWTDALAEARNGRSDGREAHR